MTDKVKYAKTKAHQRYKTIEGVAVPGVTTVLGLLNKPALLHWEWQCGVDGIDYRKSRDNAADIGSLAHWMVECHMKGLEPDTSEFSPADVGKAENAVIKFMSWWDASGLTLVSSEQQLVSERHGYGGTLDIVAVGSNGDMWLVDIKTSKAIYDEYWMQVAAYGALSNEVNVAQINKYAIVRIGKQADEGDFEVQERDNLDKYQAAFLAVLGAHKALKRLK
jgi:hypothetical protein